MLIPHSPLGIAHVMGWIDASHLALLSDQSASGFTPLPTPVPSPTAVPSPTITASPTVSGSPTAPTSHATTPSGPPAGGALNAPAASPLSSPTTAVVTLDVRTGDANLIVDAGQDTIPSLSPDGKFVLLSSSGFCAPGPCPGPTAGNAALVDTSTGQIHALVDSITLLPPTGTFFWSPDALSVAQTIPSKVSAPDSWLVNVVDLEQGAGATLRPGVFALGWSPDGKTIVVGNVTTISEGAVQASAIQVASPTTAPTALPGKMTEFLGFVKTA
jgi:hypothetical protein